jgi:hypothetical protein
MSDFNAGLEAAAKLADEADRDDENNNGIASTGAAHGLAERILALRRPDAPDAVREAGEVERLRQALREIAGLKVEDLYYGDNKDGIDNVAALYARQALGGER